MSDSGYSAVIFIIFVVAAFIITIRAILGKERKKRLAKRKTIRYQQPYYSGYSRTQPPAPPQQRPSEPSPPSFRGPGVIYGPQHAARRQYATAEEYFREGLYDRAKEEYLKTGRIFGAAKAVAAKGHESIPEAIDIIHRYAPEREEEMVRNLSRYFFDSGDIETAAIILYEYGLKDEAEAVLATIGKTYADIAKPPAVEVMQLPENLPVDVTSTESDVIAKEVQVPPEVDVTPIDPFVHVEEPKVKEVTQEPVSQEVVSQKIVPQKIKLATVDLNENCSVCMQPIKAGDSFVRCPFCDAPAHYGHLIEWIKVKPQCPNCRKKLVAKMFELQ